MDTITTMVMQVMMDDERRGVVLLLSKVINWMGQWRLVVMPILEGDSKTDVVNGQAKQMCRS